ncbi:MAG: hypothetical protein D6773_11470 [Alphaproteobacteria bacterium]|nr:MAG: hypothetical protein D6773_11470 [Alphaproteobacteria bacterium]
MGAQATTRKKTSTGINIALIGPASEEDVMVRRALNRTWLQNTLYRAPSCEAAMRLLAQDPESGFAIHPDLLIVKLEDPERMSEDDIRRIRQYRLFRDVPIAALVKAHMGGRLRCLRGKGLNMILTLEDIDSRRADIRDAVIDYWLKSFCDDCNERYFCPHGEQCSMIGVCRL